MNVHKTFRRRHGRLLNVLRTFNLRPVSTGMDMKYQKKGFTFGDSMLGSFKNYGQSKLTKNTFNG